MTVPQRVKKSVKSVVTCLANILSETAACRRNTDQNSDHHLAGRRKGMRNSDVTRRSSNMGSERCSPHPTIVPVRHVAISQRKIHNCCCTRRQQWSLFEALQNWGRILCA